MAFQQRESLFYGLLCRPLGGGRRRNQPSLCFRAPIAISTIDRPTSEKRPSRIAYNGRSQADLWFDTPGFSYRNTPVNLNRRQVIQRLMWSLRVVESEIFAQPLSGGSPIVVVVDIDILVFHASPQPLDKDIIQRPPPPVHTDPHPRHFFLDELMIALAVENHVPI